MSGNRLTVPCPGCSKRLKVPASAAGKKVRCPACQAPFKMPETTQPAVEVEALPTSPAPEMPDPLALPPLEPVSNIPAQYQQPRQATAKKTPSRRQQFQKSKKQARQQQDDEDNKWASFGYTLIFLAIASSILPLFGLQIRRLRIAGEYAPLMGMALGLIGCVLVSVGYKGRGAKVSGGIAGGLALLVIMVGAVGFILQKNDFGNGGSGRSNAEIAQAVEDQKNALIRSNRPTTSDNQNNQVTMMPINPIGDASPPAEMERRAREIASRLRNGESDPFQSGDDGNNNETDPFETQSNPRGNPTRPFDGNQGLAEQGHAKQDSSRAGDSESKPPANHTNETGSAPSNVSESANSSQLPQPDRHEVMVRRSRSSVMKRMFEVRGSNGFTPGNVKFSDLAGVEQRQQRVFIGDGSPLPGLILFQQDPMNVIVPVFPDEAPTSASIIPPQRRSALGVESERLWRCDCRDPGRVLSP